MSNLKKDLTETEGFVVGDYRVSRTIGQGTYGKVRLGYHSETNEKVIIDNDSI